LSSGAAAPPTGGGGKNEVFNVRTDNILFICAGAFNGLHKLILDRVSRGSIGFGANVRARNIELSNPHETTLSGEDELFKKYLPFFTPDTPQTSEGEPRYNLLDLVEPQDLQKFGLIPEFVGRIPVSCALSSLDEEALVRVLTEPRNALLRQYEQLFSLSGIELRFTSAAMRVVAKDASGMGTGARGLRTVLERLLGEAMFEAPGECMTQNNFVILL
jgi:ATP-dependent Clp protease ATP-binding subunit ClpX